MPDFDILDHQILHLLKINGRAHASEIARRLKANERTVRKRIERLEGSGAVRFTVVIDPSAFGYHTVLDVFMQVEPDSEGEVVEKLLEMPEIAYLALGQGTHDISIQARFKDNEAMRVFLRTRLPAIQKLKITGYCLVPEILRSIEEWSPTPEK